MKRRAALLIGLILLSLGLSGCGSKLTNQPTQGQQSVAEQSNQQPTSKKPLIIKSDNPVIIGSGEEVLGELDSAADDLVKALDSMDTLDDNDLNF